MLLFYIPRKHRKTFRFCDIFRGYRKTTPGCNGLKSTLVLTSIANGLTSLLLEYYWSVGADWFKCLIFIYTPLHPKVMRFWYNTVIFWYNTARYNFNNFKHIFVIFSFLFINLFIFVFLDKYLIVDAINISFPDSF